MGKMVRPDAVQRRASYESTSMQPISPKTEPSSPVISPTMLDLEKNLRQTGFGAGNSMTEGDFAMLDNTLVPDDHGLTDDVEGQEFLSPTSVETFFQTWA